MSEYIVPDRLRRKGWPTPRHFVAKQRYVSVVTCLEMVIDHGNQTDTHPYGHYDMLEWWLEAASLAERLK